MNVVFTIKEEPNGLWGLYRGDDRLIKQLTAGAAIKDGRELARLIYNQSGGPATVVLQTPDTRMVMAHYARHLPTSSITTI